MATDNLILLGRSGRFTVSLAALLLAASACMPGSALGQSDDFNDGNDTGWTRLNLSSAGLPASFCVYSFPDDGAGGKAYRIKALPPPAEYAPVVGPARAFSYRAENYTRLQIAVDLVNWDKTVNQALGLLVRADPIELGYTEGYALNFTPSDSTLQISEVTYETPNNLDVAPAPLDPAIARYRLVFTAYGENLLGQVFALPDVANPVASVAAVDYLHVSGKAGVFVFSNVGSSAWADAKSYTDTTFDNYAASVPPDGSLRAVIVVLNPRPNELVKQPFPTVRVGILDRETTVDASSIKLFVDGAQIPQSSLTVANEVLVPGNSTPFPGATVAYQSPNLLASGSQHTNRVVFRDSTGLAQTNEWAFTLDYNLLRAANSLPVSAGLARGFNVRLVQTNGPALGNSLARARQQLAVPPLIPAEVASTTVEQIINFDENWGVHGNFADKSPFPGLEPADYNNIAMEVTAYLELSAGLHRFGLVSDDGFELSSGTSLTDQSGLVLGSRDGGTYNGTFDFAVEADGLYPIRMIWYENGGLAYVELFSVDVATSEMTLINDPNLPGAVKAYATVAEPQITLESAAVLAPDAFAAVPSAVVDRAAHTVTVARSGSQRFYRLRASTALKIKTVAIQGGNLVLSY